MCLVTRRRRPEMRSVSSHWLVVITSAWSVWRYRDNNEGTVAMCDVSASVDDDDVSVSEVAIFRIWIRG